MPSYLTVPFYGSGAILQIYSFENRVLSIFFLDVQHGPKFENRSSCSQLQSSPIICGGSPCQDLSVAGARAGLAGARSGLFMEQIRVVKEMRAADRERGRTGKQIRPRFMLWENAPGAFSSGNPKGEDFRIVLEEILRIHLGEAEMPSFFPRSWLDV